MEQEQLIEGNKAIVAFISNMKDYAPYRDDADWISNDYAQDGSIEDTLYRWEQMEFATNWQWLMPVVELIDKTQLVGYSFFSFTSDFRSATVSAFRRGEQIDVCIYQTPYGSKPTSRIETVWLAVVAFIIWYNQQPK